MKHHILTDREFAEVVDLVTDRLTAQRAAELQERAAGEPWFASVVDGVRSLLGEVRVLPAAAGPDPGLLDRLKRVFDPAKLIAPGVDRAWNETVAELVADTRANDALAGFRGASTAYQLSFTADGFEIHLQITSSEDDRESRVSIMGQIDGEFADPGRVQLRTLVGGEVVAESTFDEHGYFSMEVGAGTYDMAVILAGRSIVIQAIELG